MNAIKEKLLKTIRSNIKYKSIQDIDRIDFKSFKALIRAVEMGEIKLGMDNTAANQLARTKIFGAFSFYLFMFLAASWMWVSIAAIVLAVLMSEYWLLAAIPVSIIGLMTANPYNPAKKFFSLVFIILCIYVLFGLIGGFETLHYLSLSYVIVFLATAYVYDMNQKLMHDLALESEEWFIYLFQSRAVAILEDGKNPITEEIEL